MAFALVNDLTQYFKKKDINEDNFACKLVHKASVAFLFVATGLVAANSVFGDPISCTDPKGHDLDKDFIKNFCWLHGTNHFPDHDVVNKNIGTLCASKINSNKVNKCNIS